MKVVYLWCAPYVIAAMLDEFDRFLIICNHIISSNMAEICLSFESQGIGCTPLSSE